MKINRREFLKMVGLVGAGAAIGGLPSGCRPRTTGESSNLDHIRSAAARVYDPIFNMSGYAAPKLDTVRIGFIGTGGRGSAAVERMSRIGGVHIRAICDIRPEKAENARKRIKTPGHDAIIISGEEESWMELCRRDDLDLVYIATPWAMHAPMAVYAMQQGKHVAVEVPAATTVDDCWRLVETSESTRRHCVILENCCYGFFELLTLNMVRHGFFGDIVHCEGAYIHDLLEGMFMKGNRYNNWRLKENASRNGNLYPTHGFGPICQIMRINCGDRLDYMTSISSADFSLNDAARERAKNDPDFRSYVDNPFRGNMNVSTIRTQSGGTIMLQHDVSSPRPYSRIHLVSGTKAFAQQYPLPGRIAVGHVDFVSDDEMARLEREYTPAIVRKIGDLAKKIGGHGGMDFIMDWRLIDCLRNGLPVDMNVYDAAAWSVVGPLSEWSVANGSSPIAIPDFTAGAWKTNFPHDIDLRAGGTTGVST